VVAAVERLAGGAAVERDLVRQLLDLGAGEDPARGMPAVVNAS
jgi:hypothetical protein